SGNWTAASQASGRRAQRAQLMLVESRTVSDTMSLQVHLTSDVPVYSLEFTANFAAANVVALEPTLTTATQEWLVSSNRREPGRIRVAMASAQPFTGDDSVLVLQFRPIAGQQEVAVLLQEARVDEAPIDLPQEMQQIFLPFIAAAR
ncbi:MAG: hypothetical protein KDE58_40645, partial [Caldilineaceae bacterium]|nr:hypothetical protein [Caldilineaceae bacterium]